MAKILPPTPGGKGRPEAKIQNAIIEMLRRKQWIVKVIHGNAYSSGLPDLYATHKFHGPRWIEVKNPESFSFTPAQKKWFPMFAANGTKIWVLVAATPEEYLKLIAGEPNWHAYLQTRGMP